MWFYLYAQFQDLINVPRTISKHQFGTKFGYLGLLTEIGANFRYTPMIFP